VPGSVFFVSENDKRKLCIKENGATYEVKFLDDKLFFGGQYASGFDQISGIYFEADETKTMIKCVTYYEYKNGDRVESHFVFSLRCGTISNGEGS
jgi:hypothetical protein